MVISIHLPPPVMIESAAERALVTHMLCWSWAMCFSAAASSENDQGSMNLASNTASRSLTKPSRVAAKKRWTGCWTQRWTSEMARPVLRSYQARLSASVATPSWTTRLSLRSSGSSLAALFLPQPDQRGFVRAHDDPCVRAAEELAAVH